MRVLALEPWHGGSHRRFLDDLVRHSSHDVRAVTMAARYWKWRMQGGAVTLADHAQQRADFNVGAFLGHDLGQHAG